MIIAIIIIAIITSVFSAYIGSGYAYQHDPEARKDLIEHM